MTKLHDPLFRGEHVCPWWLAYTFDNPLRRFLHDPQELLGRHVRPGMTVADIGCGLGYFSVAMAKMVGSTGSVTAVDLQQQMLDRMQKRAKRAGVAGLIRPVLATGDDIRLAGPVDFILLFWMVHEVSDIPKFFSQVASALAAGGRILYAEPRMHVSEDRFREIIAFARGAGLVEEGSALVRISRAVVLAKQPDSAGA